MEIPPFHGHQFLLSQKSIRGAYKLFLLIVFILLATLPGAAQNILSKPIDITFRQTTPKQVLRTLEKQTGYTFVYSQSDIAQLPSVNATFKATPLLDVLQRVFGSYLLDWKVRNSKQIILRFGAADKFSDTISRPVTLSPQVLEEVHVVGKSALKEVKEQAFNVEVLNTKELHNTSLNIATALDRVGGMRVRQGGGLGSNTNVSLNGFSGKHVKFFVDGIPLEVYGNTFQLSNVPVELAERVEVYKGVSPVSLSSDALGGVVNIVTTQRKMSYLNASYSFGSFNTHKAFLSAGINSKNDWVVRTNLLYNYSDNNYWVNGTVLDLENSAYLPGTQRVRRFHDKYENITWMLQAGIVDKPFADRLLLGINLGKENKDDQTGAQMKFVFGERTRETNTISPFLNYEKKNAFTEGLDFRVTANYNFGHFRNVDTASVRYNWLGQHIPTARPGEYNYSLSKIKDNDGGVTFNADYKLSDKHSFSLSNITTFFNRKGNDTLDYSNTAFLLAAKKKNVKNVAGLAYNYKYSENWNTSVFIKDFLQNTSGPQSTGRGEQDGYVIAKHNYHHLGYGIASTYFLGRWQFKASYENTLRLPSNEEVFGMESFNAGNIDLKPEASDNYNLNIIFDASLNDDHQIEVGAGLLYRDTRDFIISTIGGSIQAPTTRTNHGIVHNKGFNADLKYYFKRWLTIGGNVTYQDLKFKNKYDPGDSGEKISLFYDTRVPNNPYFFSNGFVNMDLSRWVRKYGQSLRLGYNTLYVYEFPLHTYEYGQHNVAMIPTQFTHNVFITYGVMNDKFTVTAEAFNLTDQDVYDNFSFQKPGRSFTVKLRYAITKSQI